MSNDPQSNPKPNHVDDLKGRVGGEQPLLLGVRALRLKVVALQAAEGVEVIQPLRDEAFGQRHFIIRDPAGTLIDLIRVIPASDAYADAWVQG